MTIPAMLIRQAHRRGEQVCHECGLPYRHERIDGVLLTACPDCRAKLRRERQDNHATQERMMLR